MHVSACFTFFLPFPLHMVVQLSSFFSELTALSPVVLSQEHRPVTSRSHKEYRKSSIETTFIGNKKKKIETGV